jgi:hypothetical protein
VTCSAASAGHPTRLITFDSHTSGHDYCRFCCFLSPSPLCCFLSPTTSFLSTSQHVSPGYLDSPRFVGPRNAAVVLEHEVRSSLPFYLGIFHGSARGWAATEGHTESAPPSRLCYVFTVSSLVLVLLRIAESPALARSEHYCAISRWQPRVEQTLAVS